MIQIQHVTFGFGDKILYNDIQLDIQENEHCVLIGSSGSGKSTLVQLMRYPDDYIYDGTIRIDPNFRFGYIKQFPDDLETHQRVFDYIAQPFTSLESDIANLCEKMAQEHDLESVFDAYQDALDQFEALGGDGYESLIYKSLNLAGLTQIAQQSIHSISNGERKLVQIIKDMLLKPHLLIMDEPDAFLDFENINALKRLINAHKGALLVITHNRHLLNHCFNKVIHLENKLLQCFEGQFTEYQLALLQGKIDMLESALADEEEVRRNEAVIDRLRFNASYNSDASRGRALKARVKLQERLLERQIMPPFLQMKAPHIQFVSSTEPESQNLVSLSQYHLEYDRLLLENVTFDIGYGEKIALIGPNGSGKTSLMRDIYTKAAPGIRYSEGLKMAFLSQNSDDIDASTHRVLSYFEDTAYDTEEKCQRFLMSIGFKEDICKQKISSLSGGERTLLQLAKIGTQDVDLLLLDEPTSHLDTYGQPAFERALAAFKGAVLMVSHDYYTINETADHVLLIDDKCVKKMSLKKFRKHIYGAFLDQPYIHFEHTKRHYEKLVEDALKANDFEKAQVHADLLKKLVADYKN